MSYIDDLNQAAAQALAASASATESSQIISDVANGDENTTVTTANGEVKSLAKAIADITAELKSGVFSTTTEVITLEAGQTLVTLTETTTNGMQLYVEGVREFDFTITSESSFTLSEALPEGTRIWVVGVEFGEDTSTSSVVEGSTGVTRTLGNWVAGIDFTFTSVQDMKSDEALAIGSKVSTLGYYTEGDGGSNSYVVVDSLEGSADEGYLVALDNGLLAKGLFPDGTLDPRQFGATTSTPDIKVYLDRLEAAAAATGKRIRVDQVYQLTTSKQVNREISFGNSGAISSSAGTSLLMAGQRSLDMNDYLPPSGYFSDQSAQMRGPIRRLFNNSAGRPVLDLGGRIITVSSPLDFESITGLTEYGFPARIQNGVINISPDFPSDTFITKGVTSTLNSNVITMDDTSGVSVGDKVTNANAFPIETFVKSVDSPTQVTINKKALGSISSGTTGFRNIKFAMDLSGMGTSNRLSFLTFDNVEFRCNGNGSAIRLPEYFQGVWFRNCMFNDPDYYGILKTNNGNSLDLQVFGCHFYSTGFNENPADRSAIAISYQGGDAHIIGNVMAYYKHAIVLGSGGYIIANNHPYQGNEGDDSAPLEPCIIFTKSGGTAAITGNYFDNSSIRLSNQDGTSESNPLGRMTITGNRWVQKATNPEFAFIEAEVWRDPSKAIADLSVVGNWFLSLSGSVDCTKVTAKFGGGLDAASFNDIHFNGNSFNGVSRVENPATVAATSTSSQNAVASFSGHFPFGGTVKRTTAVVPVVDSAQAFRVSVVNQTTNAIQVTFSGAVSGTTNITARCDTQS